MSEWDPRSPSDAAAEHRAQRTGGSRRRPAARADGPAARRDSASGGASVVTIGQFFGMLRRHLTMVLTCLLLGLALSAGLLVKTAKTYQSTAVVDITPTLPTSSSNNDVNTITEAKIATSSSVALAAAKKLGFTGSPDQLSQHVTATSPLSSQVLYITFHSSTAQGAANGANAFAQSYLDYRTNVAQADLQLRISRINDQISTLQKNKAASGQISQLMIQLNNYRTTVVTPGTVASQAAVPDGPSSPKKSLYLAAGLLFGLLIGAVLAVVRDLRDDRVWSKTDLEHSLGAPVIAEASSAEVTAKTWPRTLVSLTDPRGPEADAYRSTTMVSSGEENRIVMLCSTGRENHSLAPVNLAVSYAQQGLRTVLAGPRRALGPVNHLLGGIELSGDGPLADRVIDSAAVPHLALLNLGDEVRLGAILRGDGDQLAGLLGQADVIVLDGVNIELPSTSLRLGQLADEVVVLVYANRTTHQDLQLLAQHLAQVRASISGAILLSRQRRLGRRSRPRAAAAQSAWAEAGQPNAPLRPRADHRPDHSRRGGDTESLRPISGAAKGR